MNYQSIREACCEANRKLPATGLVDLTFGNVSVLDPDSGVFAIKPSGVDYDALTPDSMVLVDLNGEVVEGELKPSSDTPTHQRLLQAFGDAGVTSVVHTHSRNAVAFAQAGREIPCFGTTHADYFFGAVPITRELTADEIQGEYEWATGEAIVERFADLKPLDFPAVLVKSHGPFAWGKTADKAVEHALALEIIADMALKTLAANPSAEPIPDVLLKKHFLRKHGSSAYYGQG
ncbi:L-ribulose-5-phosphate 4-epimerase AraD [Rubellicoccus peritrichatus]|uniref:L-ribulose-5-phosphate 4-epimerase n=1 Tax=Rubellicoccus peritrichatus TaxID=3080537 RepID=A0AAQ3LDD1_9BACT|nr:L-ribulose-5-phosphate 4-epimerase AraD [Puniceicoccus sp. CR14]WOO42457.1 L-ribulose-5-phosphate 4-epimerase AraD [Puniceicoccus sp. CR14]